MCVCARAEEREWRKEATGLSGAVKEGGNWTEWCSGGRGAGRAIEKHTPDRYRAVLFPLMVPKRGELEDGR